jgi:hypothetical protein
MRLKRGLREEYGFKNNGKLLLQVGVWFQIPDFITMQHDQRRPEAFGSAKWAEFRRSHGSHGGAGLVQKGMHFDNHLVWCNL